MTGPDQVDSMDKNLMQRRVSMFDTGHVIGDFTDSHLCEA